MLNERQKAFADYYVASNNATESALKAGYSEKTAYSIGNENLNKVEIIAYIRDQQKALGLLRKLDIETIHNELAKIALNEKEASRDRLKALEMVAKMQGAFIDRVEHSGTMQHQNLNVNMANLTMEELREIIAKTKR